MNKLHAALKRSIKKITAYCGYTISKIPSTENPQRAKPLTYQHFLNLYFSHISPADFFFVQIGANDGTSRDTLHGYIVKYKLAGILVEPQPEVFKKLQEAYRGFPQLLFANSAIGETDGQRAFYTVKKSLINESNYFETTAIASFNKETLKKTIAKRIPEIIQPISDNLDDYIEEITVDTLSFETLVARYAIKKINLLFLDCEGYDYEIIKLVDFKKFSPGMIIYESKFFSDTDRASCEKLLVDNGYQLFRDGNDTCAFK